MSDEGRCDNCGAPWGDGLAACAYCETPIAGRASGMRCPSCGEVATPDRRSCAMCSTAFTKGCLFCGQVAWLSMVACPSCHESFEGAAERKKQREEQQKQQQMVGLAKQGMSVLGQFAGTPSGQGALGAILDFVIKSNDGSGRR